jgi:hypothetical protein
VKILGTIPVVLGTVVLIAGLAGCGAGGIVNVTPPPDLGGPPITTTACKTAVSRPAGPTATPTYTGTSIAGKVMAGTVPLIGASVQLYAAGSNGNRSTATAIGSAIATDTTGAFHISAPYTCPFNLSVLYVIARGGQTTPTGPTNPAIVLMATLGACNTISNTATFTVNEATTVASAYALAQFITVGGNVGATSTNFSGLLLAAGSEANLVNTTTGQAPGVNFPATGTPPAPILNALADTLNACIVSASACSSLYSATTVSGSTPSNTLDAMINLARNPATGAAALFTLSGQSTAFAPVPDGIPSDWTMYATYAGGGMNAPSGLGIDSAGNVRVANYFSTASFFTNTGTPSIPNGVTGNNLLNSYGLAVDQNDYAWIPNEQTSFAINGGLGTVVVFNSAGQPISGTSGFSQGGLNFPVSIAIDTNGNSWVVDYGNSHLTLMTNSGTPLSGTSGYTTQGFEFPVAVAVDSKCYGFVANQSGDTITRVAPDGSAFANFVTGSGASGVAVDQSDNVWAANYYGNSVGLLSSDAKIISSNYTGGGINHPQGIAVDGAGNVWVANYRGPSLSELAGASASAPGTVLSPAAGYGAGARLLEAYAIAIDAGGNVWVTNFGSNTVTEFVGLAAPVRTPLLGPVTIP